MKRIFVVLVLMVSVVGIRNGVAASAVGTAKVKVISALAISNISDLDFGTAAAGEAAKTVAPGSQENSENGSFRVTGEPQTNYSITLPTSINLTNGNSSIAVSAFVSFPSGTGSLGADGNQNLYVGATRAALPVTAKSGTYSGTYTVTVVY